MRIYLVRHGQSRWQIERNDEDWNSPLTELGITQAQRLAQWLVNTPSLEPQSQVEVAALYASPYLRALQTAEPIADTLGIPVRTEDSLAEADFLVSAHLPERDSPIGTFPSHEHSSAYAGFRIQAERALSRLVTSAEQAGGAVLAVSHGGLISTLLRLTIGSDFVSFWIYNASLQVIEWKRGRWHMIFLNLMDHLGPKLRTY